MKDFVELPVWLRDNTQTDDDIDYESLGIDRKEEHPDVYCEVIFNLSYIYRINSLSEDNPDKKTAIWVYDPEGSVCFHTKLSYQQVKELIAKATLD